MHVKASCHGLDIGLMFMIHCMQDIIVTSVHLTLLHCTSMYRQQGL